MTPPCQRVSPATAVSVVVPADACEDVTLCVALMSRKEVQGMCFHKEVIQE